MSGISRSRFCMKLIRYDGNGELRRAGNVVTRHIELRTTTTIAVHGTSYR